MRRQWASAKGAVAPVLEPPTPTFHFDPIDHEYFIDGEKVPSITQMLERCGYIDTRFYSEECAERGTLVHKDTAAYDLGAISDPRALECAWKGFFLAHVEAMRVLKPEILSVEVARGSIEHRFGGRPDRVLKLWGAVTVLDIKTGVVWDWHALQTALQAILVAPDHHLPPTAIQRYGLYLRDNGKYKLVEARNPRDYDEAYEIIKACTTQA